MHFRSPKPIFRQIADHIIELVLTDQWKPGERIPSVRDLAAEIEVNPNTVARTYQFLGEEGIIRTQRGIGYFLESNAPSKAKACLKKYFISDELPHLIRMMNILNMDPSELINYKNEKN